MPFSFTVLAVHIVSLLLPPPRNDSQTVLPARIIRSRNFKVDQVSPIKQVRLS